MAWGYFSFELMKNTFVRIELQAEESGIYLDFGTGNFPTESSTCSLVVSGNSSRVLVTELKKGVWNLGIFNQGSDTLDYNVQVTITDIPLPYETDSYAESNGSRLEYERKMLLNVVIGLSVVTCVISCLVVLVALLWFKSHFPRRSSIEWQNDL